MVASWWPCCCGGGTVECSNCDSSTGPAQFAVSISGLSDSVSLRCISCSNLNGTYILDHVTACTWQYDFESDLCTGPGTAPVFIRVDITEFNQLTVTINFTSVFADATFRNTYADPVLCLDLDGESVLPGLPVGNDDCDWTTVTITVSAV